MKELKDVLGMVAEGLKSFAEGMGMIAGKVDALAQSLVDPEKKPQAPKQKAAAAKPEKVKRAAPKTTAAKKAATGTAVKKPVKKAAVKAVPEKKEAETASEAVLQIISAAGQGIGPSAIMAQTGFNKKKVSNILHRLKQQGKIKNSTRGLYSK